MDTMTDDGSSIDAESGGRRKADVEMPVEPLPPPVVVVGNGEAAVPETNKVKVKVISASVRQSYRTTIDNLTAKVCSSHLRRFELSERLIPARWCFAFCICSSRRRCRPFIT